MNGEEMQEVDKFNYPGMTISSDFGIGKELALMVLEGRRVAGYFKIAYNFY